MRMCALMPGLAHAPAGPRARCEPSRRLTMTAQSRVGPVVASFSLGRTATMGFRRKTSKRIKGRWGNKGRHSRRKGTESQGIVTRLRPCETTRSHLVSDAAPPLTRRSYPVATLFRNRRPPTPRSPGKGAVVLRMSFEAPAVMMMMMMVMVADNFTYVMTYAYNVIDHITYHSMQHTTYHIIYHIPARAGTAGQTLRGAPTCLCGVRPVSPATCVLVRLL